MMKSLIIGASSFVGGYLIDHLLEDEDQKIYATKMDFEFIDNPDVHVVNLDILDKTSIVELLKMINPDYIYHLAAQSSVSVSWENPQKTIDINIKGTVNLLDAVRECDMAPKILLIGSSEEYGHVKPNELPIHEENLLRPGNIYAVTKTAQNFIGKIYHDAYDMDILMVRAFNHIGPRQSPVFAVPNFCRQVADIEAGKQEPIIHVGNLSAKRDFTDVRDIVRGYKLLVDLGKSGETYNIGSSIVVSMEEILNKIVSLSTSEIEVVIDKERLRPADIPIVRADISKIAEQTGWQPRISLEQTILDTLSFWRNQK